MKIIHTSVEEMAMRRLLIGFEGENQRATVRIDCSSVFAEYPNATPTLIVKPLFADAYPVVVDRNGTDVDWLITSEILSFTGDGEIQLVFYKDEVICKSAITKIRVCRSLTVTGDMPDPVVQWIDRANAKLAEVDAQIVELEGMVDTATDAATRAEQSASTSSTKAEQAAGSAATATEKATEATNAATTATAKAAEAQTAAQTATEKATAAADSERIATAKAVEATTAAGTATAKAEQATEAAQTATEKAADASASATAAQTSATNAASSATAASASETAAKVSETAASTSATQAAQSVLDAGANAQTAMQKAAEATQSATNAAASATSAATSAETASTKAGEAAQSAQAVEETAEQLAESLEQISQNTADIAEHEQEYNALKEATLIHNTASGAIASFTDGAEMPVDELKVQIEPVQDLHGYDHPWPAGGGVNKFDGEWESGNLNGTTGEESANPSFSRSVNFIAVLSNTAYYVYGSEITNTSEVFVFAYQDDGTYISYQKLESNGTYTTPSNCAKVRLQVRRTIETVTNYLYAINYPNTVTTYSPYSNICPITGWDGVRVTRTGKNLLDESNLLLAEGWTVTDGVYSGTNTALHIAFSNGFPGMAFKPDTTYTVSLVFRSTTASKITVIGFNYTDGTHSTMYMQDTVEHTVSFTSTSGKSVSNLLLSYGASDKVYISQMQVEEGSAATDYEPYAGNTYDITLPTEAGTVYGGTLDVSTGELVVDRAIVTKTWAQFTNKIRGDVYLEGRAELPLINSTRRTEAICSRLKYSSSSADYGHCFYVPSGGNYARVLLFSAEDTDEFVFVYLISNPQTYQLTASEIRTLLGENNVWADAGSVNNMVYCADTKLYIDQKIKEAIKKLDPTPEPV